MATSIAAVDAQLWWRLPQHPSVHSLALFLIRVPGGLEPIPATIGQEARYKVWRRANTETDHSHSHSHLWTNLESSINLTLLTACLWTVGEYPGRNHRENMRTVLYVWWVLWLIILMENMNGTFTSWSSLLHSIAVCRSVSLTVTFTLDVERALLFVLHYFSSFAFDFSLAMNIRCTNLLLWRRQKKEIKILFNCLNAFEFCLQYSAVPNNSYQFNYSHSVTRLYGDYADFPL